MALSKIEGSRFYLVQANGKVSTVKQGNTAVLVDSSVEIKRIAFASQPRDVLYGIGSDLKVYIWVTEPVSPIRQKLETYENERWTPMRGYSDTLLPTDRYNWSDEAGRCERTRESVQLPSQHWTWETSTWEIDESFNGELLGPDGWSYAIDFPSVFYPEKKWNSMVRRRKWIRYCRYRATNRWARMTYDSSMENEIAFVDISAGGCDVSYTDRPSLVLLWAVSTNNQVFVRHDCLLSNAYNGSVWKLVDLPQQCEVVQISCGPADSTWAVMTQGWALTRLGISRDYPFGTGWCLVEPPGRSSLLSHIAVGPSTVWALSKDGSVWFRQGIRDSCLSGTSWVKIPDFSADCISISRNSEVFAISHEDKHIYWRSGVSLEDPHGKRWKKLSVLPAHQASVDGTSSPWIWISATAGFVDSSSSLWDDGDVWREEIVTQLKKRFDREMKCFSEFERVIERGDWNHNGRVRVWSVRNSEWDDCILEMKCSLEDNSDSCLNIEGQWIKMSVRLSDLTSVMLNENPQEDQELWLFTAFFTRAYSPLRITGPRIELDSWNEVLMDFLLNSHKLKEIPKNDLLWILSPVSRCPLVCVSNILQPIPTLTWITVEGHFEVIESASGITWALGHNKSVWIWTGNYIGKTGMEKRIQTDSHNVEVYENQRWNPVGGFSSVSLPSDRWLWSNETGKIQLTKDSFQLPSSSWRWDSEWQIDWKDADEDGWRYAFDFPASYHAKKLVTDCVRRRRWWRQMKVENHGPWLPGPNTKLKSISICAGIKSGNIIPVWGITADGNVLLRDKVSVNSPQGETWIPVKTPEKFVHISVGPFCVWGTSVDGIAYVRNGTKDKMDGLYWFQVERPSDAASLRAVEVGGNSVWALSSENRLYFRRDFSAAFPEGTEWVFVERDILNISVSYDDQLFAICKLPNQIIPVLSRRTGIRGDEKMGNGWEHGLFAELVSYRGSTFDN